MRSIVSSHSDEPLCGVGRCIASDTLEASEGACCSAPATNDTHICFIGILEGFTANDVLGASRYCLATSSMRALVPPGSAPCSVALDCADAATHGEFRPVQCVVPDLGDATGAERLIAVHRFSHRTKVSSIQSNLNAHFLFVGRPPLLFSAVSLSSYRIRPSAEKWIPDAFLSFMIALPDRVSWLLRYIIAVSLSLALLNAAPVHLVDGAASLENVIDLCMGRFGQGAGHNGHTVTLQQMTHENDQKQSQQRTRDFLLRWTLRAGSTLLLINIALTFIQVFG